MIRVDDHEWPLLTIRVGPDSLDIAASQVPVLTRLCLPGPRAILAVVHGDGLRAVASLHAVVRWIRQFELVLTTDACGIAWCIDDEALRTLTAAQLRLQDDFAFGCPSRVFAAAGAGAQWLTALLSPATPAAPGA